MASTLQPLSRGSEEPSVVNVIAKVRFSANGTNSSSRHYPVMQSRTVEREVESDSNQCSQVRPNMWSSRNNTDNRVIVGENGVVASADVVEKQQQSLLRVGVPGDEVESIRDRMINSSSNSTRVSTDVPHAVSQSLAPISGTEVWTNKPYLGVALLPNQGDVPERMVVGGSVEVGSFADQGISRGARRHTPPPQQSDKTTTSVSSFAQHTEVGGELHEHARYPRAIPQHQQPHQHIYHTNQSHMYNGGQYSTGPERETYDCYYSDQSYSLSSSRHVQQPRHPNRQQHQNYYHNHHHHHNHHYQHQRSHQQQQSSSSHYYAPQQDPQGWRIRGDTRYGYSDPNNYGPTQCNQRYPCSAGGSSANGGGSGPMVQQYNNSTPLSSAPTPLSSSHAALSQPQWSGLQMQYPPTNMPSVEVSLPSSTPTSHSAQYIMHQQVNSSYPGSGEGSFLRYSSSASTARAGVTSSPDAPYGGSSFNWRTQPRYSDDSPQRHAVPPAYHGSGMVSSTPHQSQTPSGARADYPDGCNQGQYQNNTQWNYGFGAQHAVPNAANYHQQAGRQGYNCTPYGPLGGPGGAVSTRSMVGNMPSYAPPPPLSASGYTFLQQQQLDQYAARGPILYKGDGRPCVPPFTGPTQEQQQQHSQRKTRQHSPNRRGDGDSNGWGPVVASQGTRGQQKLRQQPARQLEGLLHPTPSMVIWSENAVTHQILNDTNDKAGSSSTNFGKEVAHSEEEK